MNYEEIDITKNPGAYQKIVEITHQTGVPQTVVDGSIIIGYNIELLSQKLGITN